MSSAERSENFLTLFKWAFCRRLGFRLLGISGGTVGLYGVTPVTRAAAITAPTAPVQVTFRQKPAL